MNDLPTDENDRPDLLAIAAQNVVTLSAGCARLRAQIEAVERFRDSLRGAKRRDGLRRRASRHDPRHPRPSAHDKCCPYLRCAHPACCGYYGQPRAFPPADGIATVRRALAATRPTDTESETPA